MSPRLEEELLTRDTLNVGMPIVMRHLPEADVDSDMFDLFVLVPGNRPVPRETAYAIARDLRGGRDHDTSMPSDWHVRSMGPAPEFWDDGTPRPGPVKTSIWLSSTYRIPDGYDELGTGMGVIQAPGVRPLSA